jgi:hypothetical protein
MTDAGDEGTKVTEAPIRPERPDGLSLALNFLPFGMLLIGAGLSIWLADGFGAATLFLGWLYLAPALIGGLVTRVRPTPTGTFGLGDAGYRHWWLMLQLQLPFNRLPFLEEALRLVPGLYPAWIRLWGGYLSAESFVGPGVMIGDRHLIRVGPRSVLGARAGFAGHIAFRDERGRWQVIVAPCEVGADAIVGGDAGMGPGAKLADGATLPAARHLGPGKHWPPRGEAE